jgi:hypothetical protein
MCDCHYTVNGYAFIVNFFRHVSMYETGLYTYNLYGTGVAVDFFLPGEKNSNIVTATHILISRIKVIC